MVSPTAVALCHVWLHWRILVPQWFCPYGQWTMSSPKEIQKQSHSCSCQGCKATNHTETLLNLAKHWNSPEPSGTFRKLPPEPTPAHTGTLRNLPEPSRNLPEPASGSYTSTHRNSPKPAPRTYTSTHRNSPEPSGTLRNLPEVASGTHTSTHRNPPEPSGTCLRNLHQHTPETYTSTHRNSPEPSGTLRNLPEPSSGTCSSNPHRHTPELIWAEDPISLRCWGNMLVSHIICCQEQWTSTVWGKLGHSQPMGPIFGICIVGTTMKSERRSCSETSIWGIYNTGHLVAATSWTQNLRI